MHQCVKCGKMYEDGAKELLKGCECSGRFFFFVSKKQLEEAKNIQISLTDDDKKQIEKDVFEMIGVKDIDRPVILDLENVRVLKPGQYEIDLVDLFKKKPLVYRLDDGKYVIDLLSVFDAKKE